MIGQFRNRIEILTPSRTDDGAGGGSVAWLPGPEIWARVERLSSTQDFAGDRNNRLKRVAATIRHRTDVALGHQILFDFVVYEIVSIEDDDPGRRLILICEEAPS